MFEFFFKYSRDIYARSDWVFVGEWPAGVLFALAALGILGATATIVRHRNTAATAQLLSIWMLQLALFATVLFMLLQPSLRTENLKPGENTLALVLDTSESMLYGEPQTRFNAALENLATVAEETGALGLGLQRYTLASTAERVTTFADVGATGLTTSIGASVARILEDARTQSLAAIVLTSDGIDTAGGISAEEIAAIAAYGVPVHTIAVGRDALPEDLELTQVRLADNALPKSKLPAQVAIRHDRPGNVRVKVYDDDDLIASVPVELLADTSTTTARVDVELADAGYHRLQFVVDGGEEEQELRNNRLTTLINVAEQDFRLLYFEGEPRWEYKFLRRALETVRDIKLVSLLRVSPNRFYRQGLESAEQLENGFPSSRDELFQYDAVIIGSVEAASFTQEQQEILHDFVSVRGGSLLMLAGPNGLGNGGWGQSALADVLPARLPPSSVDSFVRKKAAPLLTPQGSDLEMLQLADSVEENRRLWQGLPEVADYQATGALKPAAMTLVNAMTANGAQPLLITQPFGRGQAYILASGGTWRWQMSLPVEDQRHETFWQQLLRALVANAPPNVSLSVNDSRGDAEIQLRAEFRDEAFRPADGLQVSAVVSHENGESWTVDLLPSPDESGVFIAGTPLTSSGSWYFEAVASRDGQPYDVARSSHYSESTEAEYVNIRRDSALLKRLSVATGGEYFESGNLGALPDLLRYSTAGITEQVFRDVWDAPALFIVLLLLKTGEWLLRRRWRTI